MLRTLTKGWYLCCCNYRRRNMNYIQIFIPLKAVFFLEGIQRSSLIIRNEQINQGKYFDETVKKSDNHCKQRMD